MSVVVYLQVNTECSNRKGKEVSLFYLAMESSLISCQVYSLCMDKKPLKDKEWVLHHESQNYNVEDYVTYIGYCR